MRFFQFFLVLLLTLPAIAAEKQVLTHETMWLMKRVGAPVPSPDGQWVITSITEPSYDSEKQVSDLWIVPADGSAAPRRLTSSKGAEGGVAWSPDSSHIAFAAKREGDEKDQIYILPLTGGEAYRITTLTTGATSPVWSPDGSLILFESDVYPGAKSEKENEEAVKKHKDRKYNAYVYEGFPIRYWDEWLDETRVHLFVQKAERDAESRDLLAGTELAKKAGFAASPGGFGAVWAPDGKTIVFAALVNRDESARATVVSHLFRLYLDGGEPTDLTPDAHSYSDPKFSPDGKALHALYEPTNEFAYNLNRLVRFSWPEPGDAKILTSGFDRSVSSFAFSPDGRSAFIQADDEAVTKIFRMPADGGRVEPIVNIEEGTYSGLAVPEKSKEPIILASWQSHRYPSEVVRIDPAAKNHRQLTDLNAEEAAKLDAHPARHFWFTSKKGRRIHNLLILPPEFDEAKKYPLVLFIHGGPHSSSQDFFHLRWNYLLMASNGYALLMTNYTGSTSFGEKFAQNIQGDPLKTPGDELNEAVDEAIRRFSFIDGSRVAAGGASYGGHLSNWLQATADRYVCLYSHAGLISLEGQWATSDLIYHRERNNGGPYWGNSKIWAEQSPFTYPENFKTPVLLTIGLNDFRVPLNQTLGYWSILKRLEVPSRLVVFPRANHWIMNGEDNRFFYQELNGWLEKYLGKN